MKGANTVTIKDLAGHRSLETTNRYVHLSPNHRTTAIGLLDQRTEAADQMEGDSVTGFSHRTQKSETAATVGPWSAASKELLTS